LGQSLAFKVTPIHELYVTLPSSSGPIKTPVGACATAAESVEIGADCILSGKAEIVIVGGYDDFGEESSYEFAQMKATSNSETELKMGRTPKVILYDMFIVTRY
jgi:3-oxoacyl-(acyl-carrier-protein) synthase